MNKHFRFKQLLSLTTLAIIFFLSSCEKEINVNLSESEKQLVVQGSIEKNELPYVSLTNSIGFFDKIDLGSIQYIHGADIIVKDLSNKDSIRLKEYNIDTTVGNQTFNFSIYGPDFNDPIAMAFKGKEGHIYQLSILYNGKLHTSATQIPANLGLDSIWTEPVPNKEDSFAVVYVKYSDPDTFGNSIRYETLVNKMNKNGSPEIYYTAFNSVYNDDIINGTTVPFSIDMGYDKSKNYSNQELQTLGYINRGDTVTLKWSTIDKSVYRFWETVAFAAGSVGNPFASPIKIQGNITDALGVWAGYNPMLYKIADTL
ncbi:MAG: DUF4249 family protein [Chitinophagaceae bacterium]